MPGYPDHHHRQRRQLMIEMMRASIFVDASKFSLFLIATSLHTKFEIDNETRCGIYFWCARNWNWRIARIGPYS